MLFLWNLRVERFEYSPLYRGIVTKTRKPLDVCFATKPGQLPFRIMPHIKLSLLYCTGQIPSGLKVLDNSPIAVRTKRIRLRRYSLPK